MDGEIPNTVDLASNLMKIYLFLGKYLLKSKLGSYLQATGIPCS